MICAATRTLTAFVVLAAAVAAQGAAIQLRTQCQPRTPLVRLSDVAEIVSSDPQEATILSAVELFPAPPAGQQRFLTLRELQELLTLRGVNLAKLQISGASQVTIRSATVATTVTTRAPAPQAPADARRAEQIVRQTLLKYLQQRGVSSESCAIELRLNEEQARLVSAGNRRVTLAGGTPPLIGPQRLELIVETANGVQRSPLDVQITPPQAVVVAARPIGKGDLIRPSDVQLASANQPLSGGESLKSVDAVIGREAVRAIPSGRPLGSEDVRTPVVIRRGDVVTVYARSPGIRVKTVARARQEGSSGELIELESLQNRKTYIARVTGFQEAEVFGQAVEAASTTAAVHSPTRR